jgi:tetratricopeptide (TPR) repeat protein
VQAAGGSPTTQFVSHHLFPIGRAAALLFVSVACVGPQPDAPAKAAARSGPLQRGATQEAPPKAAVPKAAVPRAPVPSAAVVAATQPTTIAPATIAPASNAAAAIGLPLEASTGPRHETAAEEARGDGFADERTLRHEIATGDDPTGAALTLAAQLTADERHAEALLVLERAAARRPSPPLRIARAGVLRDLGRRHEAVEEMRALLAHSGVEALHPRLLFELAELHWLEGDRNAALDLLRRTLEVHAADAWVQQHRQELTSLQAEVDRAPRPERVRVRDLLGNLRGAPNPTDRVQVLERLLGSARVEPDAERRGELHDLTIGIAVDDPSPLVRSRALQLVAFADERQAAICVAALEDTDALVRRRAAERLAEIDDAEHRIARALLGALRREDDGATFAALHEALCRCTRTTDAPAAIVDGPSFRARALEHWNRAEWARTH